MAEHMFIYKYDTIYLWKLKGLCWLPMVALENQWVVDLAVMLGVMAVVLLVAQEQQDSLPQTLL
jgi:hypothetical protein